MSITTITSRPPFEESSPAAPEYWEARARRFARDGAGLRAVCSYGMPGFYNGYINLLQHRAIAPWVKRASGKRVLDVGCGVGRWSRLLSHAGATVTGVDLSETMIAEARRRACAEHLDDKTCRFLVADVAGLDLGEQFDFILTVTVLQHVLQPGGLHTSLRALAQHLDANGQMVLLEVAPSRPTARCDSNVFVARDESAYHHAFEQAGLRCVEMYGVDPAPFKTWVLPWYRRLPPMSAVTALAAATAASLPIDLLLARHLRKASWHKVFVVEHAVRSHSPGASC